MRREMNAVGCTLTRFTGYTLLIGGLLAMLPALARGGGADSLMGEGGVLEWFQWTVIVSAGAVLGWSAWRLPPMRAVLALLASLAFVAGLRELDYWFDRRLPRLGWQTPAVLVLAAGAMTAWRARQRFGQQVQRFLALPAAGLLWAGAVTVLLFAQLVGHGAFMEALMGAHYARAHKRVIEELAEAFGYVLILLGAIELRIGLGRSAAAPSSR
jgi:hypothetical protein